MVHPGGPLTNFNDGGGGGGVRPRFLFYTPKNHNFRICPPQKITIFLVYPKNSLSHFLTTPPPPPQSLCFISGPKKIPASFIGPKISLLAKISDPKNHSDPPVIKICEWVPGWFTLSTHLCQKDSEIYSGLNVVS